MDALILQPDENDPTSRDTIIADSLYATTNYGDWPQLLIGTYNVIKDLQARFRSILRFDLSALLGATIKDATLTLTAMPGSTLTSETFTIHRLTQPNWTELGATWNTYNGSNNWAVAGGDFVSAPVQSLVLTSPQDLVFDDVRSLVEDAVELRGGMLDVLIKGAATSGFQLLYLYSSSEANPLIRPTLVVNYDYPPWCVEIADEADWSVAVEDKGC